MCLQIHNFVTNEKFFYFYYNTNYNNLCLFLLYIQFSGVILLMFLNL